MANKTAMRKLLDYLEEDDRINRNAKVFQDALEEEKEQIMEAYWEGGQDVPINPKRADEYYNKTYSPTPINKEA